MWQAHVDEPSDHYVSHIPNLRKSNDHPHAKEQTNQEKSEMLYKMFFKPRPELATEYNMNQYPDPVSTFSTISNEQIHQAIKRLSSHKAPGPNGVCNAVFIRTADLLIPHLGHLFRATFELEFYPEMWKLSSTVMLRKPGRPDYTTPKEDDEDIKGIKARMMKKLYEGVAMLKMLYTVDVWGVGMVENGRGKKDNGWGACGFGKKMESVQRLVAIHITGGMRSTATDMLFTHADLQPIPILLQQHCSHTVLRMATLP